jgi:hypothetical protein
MARALRPAQTNTAFQECLPAVGTPGRRSIHGLSATPDDGSMIKITAGSKPCLSAIWLRKGKKVLTCWYNVTKFTRLTRTDSD